MRLAKGTMPRGGTEANTNKQKTGTQKMEEENGRTDIIVADRTPRMGNGLRNGPSEKKGPSVKKGPRSRILVRSVGRSLAYPLARPGA